MEKYERRDLHMYSNDEIYTIICNGCKKTLNDLPEYALNHSFTYIDDGTHIEQQNMFNKLIKNKTYNINMENVYQFYCQYVLQYDKFNNIKIYQNKTNRNK